MLKQPPLNLTYDFDFIIGNILAVVALIIILAIALAILLLLVWGCCEYGIKIRDEISKRSL